MTRGRSVAGVCFALLMVSLGACGTEAEPASAPTEGAVALAVSEICSPGSSPQCVPVNGEHVLVIDSEFARAGVVSVEPIAEDNALDLRFTSEGETTFQAAAAEAAQAGQSSRLVMKAGEVVLSAVMVPEPLEAGGNARIQLPPDVSGEDAVDLILAN